MILNEFSPSDKDTWTWRQAGLNDLDAMVDMSNQQYGNEVDQVFTINKNRYAQNLAIAIINQKFDTLKEQVIVAESNGRLLGYAWLQRGNFVQYSDDEIAEARFIHLDQTLSPRIKICLVAQILQQWELWAIICGIPVICSSTIRDDQGVFLKLHTKAGYKLKGSIAFKRLKGEEK
jgi:hypothetical protein